MNNDHPDKDIFAEQVAARFGLVPNFFCSAPAAPGLIEDLWAFAKSAYVDSPLPSVFKERLFVSLSRFCEVRYCIVRHVGFLIGEGHAAGDPEAVPETIEQVMALLSRPLPDSAALAGSLARLEAHRAPADIPALHTQAEADLFDALAVMFVSPRQSQRARGAIRTAVGEARFEILTALLAFVRTAHYWTEIHPELAYEPDMVATIHRYPDLAHVLLDRSEAERIQAGEALRNALTELDEARDALVEVTAERTREAVEHAHAEEALRARGQHLANELTAMQRLQSVSAQLIQEDDPEAIYRHLIDAAAFVMHADFASMQMLHPERGELELLSHKGFSTEAAVFWKWVRPESGSTCAMALRTGQRVIAPDVERSDCMAGIQDLETCLRMGIHAVQTTPLVSREGRVLGMISTHWKKPHEPAEHDLRLLDVLARQAADLIERIQADEALRGSEQRYRELYDNNPTMYFTLSRDGTVQSVNRFGAEMLGYEAEALIGQSFFKLHREDTSQAQARLDECFERPGEVLDWETRIEHRNGSRMWVRESARAVAHPGAALSVLVVCEDMTERRELMRQATYYATHDALTGLENRREFEGRLARVMETAQEQGTDNVLCYLDLDQFKIINDACGHLAGDELLRQVGEVLRGHVPTRDTVARVRGDEFGLLMEHCSLAQGERVAQECLRAVEGFRFRWDDNVFTIGISIGVLVITPEFRHMEDVLQAADAACYAAKLSGRNRVNVYQDADSGMDQRRAEMSWLTHLSGVIKRGAMQVSYQPIVALAPERDEAVHYEMLVRVRDQHGECMPAAAFLPTAERYDLAARLDRWVAEYVLDWFRDHPAQIERLTWCSINLSAQTLSDDSYLELVKRKLMEGPLPPHKVCFEITETAAITNIASAMRFMKQLKETGCLFALDDFGSGFSSFSYLRELPVEFLKIDGSFVRDMDQDPIDFAMVKSLNEIGHVMGKQTIAEYVERDGVLQRLRDLGVDYVQGHALGAPQPLEAMLTT